MDIKKLQTRPFSTFNDDWALVTSGPVDKHNSMTISWGEMGTLWNKNVVTIFVKPCRYTYKFMEENEYFVVSFFDERYKNALKIMGSKSGRDVNKDDESGLTPMKYGQVTTYLEAKMTIICKKIYSNDLVLENIPEAERKKHYEIDKPHRMYIGEVVKII